MIDKRTFLPDNLKKNDKEMQGLLKRVWPKLTKNTLDKIMPKPPRDGRFRRFTYNYIVSNIGTELHG
jgi:hypothetical protein